MKLEVAAVTFKEICKNFTGELPPFLQWYEKFVVIQTTHDVNHSPATVFHAFESCKVFFYLYYIYLWYQSLAVEYCPKLAGPGTISRSQMQKNLLFRRKVCRKIVHSPSLEHVPRMLYGVEVCRCVCHFKTNQSCSCSLGTNVPCLAASWSPLALCADVDKRAFSAHL